MQAGLTVGNALSPFTERIVGMSVGRAATGQLRLVSDLARETQELLGITSETPPVDVCDETRGPGYGLMDVAIRNTLTRAARGDGILLDPVYTGKAFAGLLAMIEDGRIHRRSRVLFIHSGGSPALFAYPEFISEGKPDVA